VPNNSDSCAKVCEILLLLELLRRQRPDLRLGQAESLLSLVAEFDPARRLLLPSGRAARIIKEGLLLGHLPHAKVRPKTPLEALVVGLEVAPELLPPETPATRVTENGFARASRFITEKVRPFGIPVRLPPGTRTKIRRLIKPLKTLAGDDRIQNLACGIALPFAFKAVTSGNRFLGAVGAVTLLGCGIEFAVDDPQFMGPGLIELLPDVVQERLGLPGGRN